MTAMQTCWAIWLCGLPIAPLVFHKLQLWQAQGFWTHLFLVAFLIKLFITKAAWRLPTALAWFVGWAMLNTVWRFNDHIMLYQAYLPSILMPLMSVLAVAALLLCGMSQWTTDFLPKLLRAWAVSFCLVIAYGLCQIAKWDQFFTNPAGWAVGSVGNPHHFAVYLCLGVPLLALVQERWAKAGMIGAGVLLVTLAAVQRTAGGVLLAPWLLWKLWRWKRTAALGVACALAAALWWFLSQPNLIDLQYRWLAWQEALAYWKTSPILGIGLGGIFFLSERVLTGGPLFGWFQLHNAPLQFLTEVGVIGLALLLWFVGESLTQIRRVWAVPCAQGLAWTWILFVVATLYSFPDRLWINGSLGLVAYLGCRILAPSLKEVK